MITFSETGQTVTLDDYGSFAHLGAGVDRLRAEAAILAPRLKGRRVWMLSSTAQGGGVAEMLPKVVSLLNESGVPTRWVVMGSDRAEFFRLTKCLHNLIHGHGNPELGPADKELYEEVSRATADALERHLSATDILVIHDPQPLGAGALLKERLGLMLIWRCHVGLDERTAATRAAWTFLKPYATACDRAVFTAAEYVPDYLAGRASLISPAIDPLSHKNRTLSPHKLVGILCNAGLAQAHAPVLTPPFPQPAQRLQPDGTLGAATLPEEIGLLYRPVITQVSRWDRLKGFLPLLRGFERLKCGRGRKHASVDPRHRRRLEIVRLVLAGPDPESIQDDPEGRAVFAELSSAYAALDPSLQRDVAVISLPMDSRKTNALMVNALQHCADLAVQNSLREGFGLTVTEAMWKRTPVLGTHAVGIRHQVRDGLDGRLVHDPEDPAEIARMLDTIIADPKSRDAWGRNGQRRVQDEFLVFGQVCKWLRLLARSSGARARALGG